MNLFLGSKKSPGAVASGDRPLLVAGGFLDCSEHVREFLAERREPGMAPIAFPKMLDSRQVRLLERLLQLAPVTPSQIKMLREDRLSEHGPDLEVGIHGSPLDAQPPKRLMVLEVDADARRDRLVLPIPAHGFTSFVGAS